jgi:predicted dehydrogenase
MSFKICMIGCGGFARQCHGPAQRHYAATRTDVQLAGCCDVDEDRARDFSGTFGFGHHYTDVRGMLDSEEPDAVVVAVPPRATCHAAMLVLQRGFTVLLEKPPGLSPSELEQMLGAAMEGGAQAQVAFNRRYMPVMLRAKAILDGQFQPGSIGRIDYEMIRFDRWDADFSTTAIHALDAVLFLSGSPFVSAEVHVQFQRRQDREAASFVVEAECASGTKVLLNIQPVSGRNAESATIHSVGQSLEVRIPVSPESSEGGSLRHWRGDRLAAFHSDSQGDAVDWLGVSGETEAFLDAARSGATLTPGLQDCRQQVALMEAMRLRRSGLIHFPS